MDRVDFRFRSERDGSRLILLKQVGAVDADSRTSMTLDEYATLTATGKKSSVTSPDQRGFVLITAFHIFYLGQVRQFRFIR